jgi:uncharacterized protein YacL
MPCSVTCSISAVFIIGMIYFYNSTSKSEIVKTYKEQLPPKLQILYEKLSVERMHISLYGYVLGLIVSLFIIFYNIKFKRTGLGNLSLVCLVTTTCFLTNYFYYILSPKSDWMLNHINNQRVAKLWTQMYREMQFNYHMGIVLGILAVGIFAFAFRC